MSGLDDLIGGEPGSASGPGLDELLAGLLGGAPAGASPAPAAGTSRLGDLLGGLAGGGPGDRSGLVASLGPLLGGLLAPGGLERLLTGLRAGGLAEQADSWVGPGPNEPVSGAQLDSAPAGHELAERLATEAGITEAQAAEILARVMPPLVDRLTPYGTPPDDPAPGAD